MYRLWKQNQAQKYKAPPQQIKLKSKELYCDTSTQKVTINQGHQVCEKNPMSHI